MEDQGDGRYVKPGNGYLDPRPDCEECGGTGFKKKEVRLPEDNKILDTYIGICPICGSENGLYFHLKGDPPPPERAYGLPPCMNDECPNKNCEWVNIESLEQS